MKFSYWTKIEKSNRVHFYAFSFYVGTFRKCFLFLFLFNKITVKCNNIQVLFYWEYVISNDNILEDMRNELPVEKTWVINVLIIYLQNKEDEEIDIRSTPDSGYKLRLINYDPRKKMTIIKQVKEIVENINIIQVILVFLLSPVYSQC